MSEKIKCENCGEEMRWHSVPMDCFSFLLRQLSEAKEGLNKIYDLVKTSSSYDPIRRICEKSLGIPSPLDEVSSPAESREEGENG